MSLTSTSSSVSLTSTVASATTLLNVTKVTTQIPLTTIFTPPAGCADIPYTFSTSPQSGLSTFWRDASGPGNGTRAECYPSNFSYQNKPNITVQYSPGVCPSGYIAASQAQGDTAIGQYTSWCCPQGMSYAPSYGCYTTIQTPTMVMVGTANVTMTSAFVAADWYIPVAWATAQLNEFTPRSAPLLAPETSAANTSTPLPSPGLSGTEVAGIGVGGTVGFVAVVAVACYALWRRKRRMPRDQALLGEEAGSSSLSPEELQKRADSCQGEDPGSATAMAQTDTSFLMAGQQHGGARMRDNNPLGWTVDRQPSFPIDETQPPMEPR